VSFGTPYLLFGLLAVPLAAVGYWVLERRRARRSGSWSGQAMLPNTVRRPSSKLRIVPAALFLLGLTFLLVGFARPQQILSSSHGEGAAIVLTIDISNSMAADDVKPTRILAARSAAIRFLHKLPSKYRVALVTFSDKSRLVVGPTFNHGRVIANLPDTATLLAGTAIGDAINEAVAVTVQTVGKSTPGTPNPPGAVLLISDGQQTAVGTRPEDAAQHALVNGIPIDTLTVGTPRGIVQQPVKTYGGQVSTQTVPVPVNPTTLQNVSQLTGGKSLQTGSGSQLARVYQNLGSHTAHGHRTHELSAAAAVVALILILAGVLLSGLWYGRLA
jgi:Ca-activated chloride channel homolog